MATTCVPPTRQHGLKEEISVGWALIDERNEYPRGCWNLTRDTRAGGAVKLASKTTSMHRIRVIGLERDTHIFVAHDIDIVSTYAFRLI